MAAAAFALAATAGPAFADDEKKDEKSEEAERVEMAAEVLAAATKAEDASIPQSLLEKATGIAVVPHVVKGAFGVGGRWGKGLVSSRTASGWSAPAFIDVGGVSYGFQIGVQATDLVLVFTDAKGLEALLSDKLKLGADVSVAAGPVGRSAEIGTNATLDTGIYAYSRTKGLFAGVALDGMVVGLDDSANTKVYGPKLEVAQILSGKLEPPASVRPLVKALEKTAPAPKS